MALTKPVINKFDGIQTNGFYVITEANLNIEKKVATVHVLGFLSQAAFEGKRTPIEDRWITFEEASSIMTPELLASLFSILRTHDEFIEASEVPVTPVVPDIQERP